MMARLKEPHFQMSWMQRLEPCNKYAWSRVWMGRRECAAQQQGGKKSILMNIPTRQCLRKRKRDKTEPSFQEHRASVQKQKNGSISEDTKQRWNFITLLGLQPRAFAQGCKPQATHYLCLQMFSLRMIPTDVNSSISLASTQNTLLVPFCSTSSS